VSSTALQSGLPARYHHLPAAGLAVLAVVLLVGLPEILGNLGRLAAVLVLQLGLVLAWVLVTGIQGFAGSLAVGAAAAVAADLSLVLPERPSLGEILVVLGLGFLAVVLLQMLRRPRADLVASLSGGLLLISAVAALAALLLLGRSDSGSGWARVAVLAIGAALVVGHLVDLVLPRPQLTFDVPRGLLGLVAAVLAGAGVAVVAGATTGLTEKLAAVIYGAALAGVAALTALAASYVVVEATAAPDPSAGAAGGAPAGRPPSRWALAVLQVVLPLAACAPVALALHAVL
jgi:hypothetical protein